MPELRTPLRPILKWAGGKRQLLPELRPFYPKAFQRYFEPFLGSGAVFLDLYNAGLLDEREARLSDINADVIGCYRAVRDEVEEVIRALRAHDRCYRAAGGAHYYDVRDAGFNPARRRLGRRGMDRYTPALAAMLIFLNRTGFNGLYRLNAGGDFNVPHGRHSAPRICDVDNLRAWSRMLRRGRVRLEARPFDAALDEVAEGDFVYLDPPYAPVSGTARFTAYTAGGFGPEQQERLQRSVIDSALRGAAVLLSNSAAPQIKALYQRHRGARHAGLRATTVQARRAINARAAARGPVSEYLITNVKP